MDITFTGGAALALCVLVGTWYFTRARRLNPRLWRTKLAAGFLAVTIVLTYFSWGDWSVYLRTKNWITTDATILSVENDLVKWRGSDLRKGGAPVYVAAKTVEVSYMADGQEETWSGTLDGYSTTGETIQIKYDPDNPTSIVEVTATSDEVTPGWADLSLPAGVATNNTVSSVSGLPTPALAVMCLWIAAGPLLTTVLATWLVPRRRQAGSPQDSAVLDSAAQPRPATAFERLLAYSSAFALTVLIVAALVESA